jgi:hypothetical protein
MPRLIHAFRTLVFGTALAFATLAACSGSPSSGGSHADGGSGSEGGPPDGTADHARHDGNGDAVTSIPCTPPKGNPAVGSPTIVDAPSPVAPGQVALLFGANVGDGAKVYGIELVDSDPGDPPRPTDCVPPPAMATSLEVLQASGEAAMAVIPSAWTMGLYALIVENAAGASLPVVLNRPRVDWIRGAPGGGLAAGATVDVYGRSFGKNPRAWLTNASGKSTALSFASDTDSGSASSDGYAATFAVPTLPAGAYLLYVHSGMGGAAGFSDPLAVSVVAPDAWPSTVYKVLAGTGNDDDALAAALKSAAAGDGGPTSGGIVELATGSYTLTKGVVIPPKTALRSATGNRKDVTITFNEPSSPFPYGFAGDGDFRVESITVTSSTSERLFQCPNGPDFLRPPQSGEPQYQPDPPCQNATLHDVSFTLTTQETAATIMVVINGDDCEISDSSLTNREGSALSLAKGIRFNVLRNTLVSGSTRVPASQPMPISNATGSVGGGCGVYGLRESAVVGNTIGPTPDLGAASLMYIEYDAHDLYIADNTMGPNLSNYGEGFSFDAPYYPNFLGVPTAVAGRSVTIPSVFNAAGNSVYQGPLNGMWTANSGTVSPGSTPTLVGSSAVVVNGTGLGQYAEVVSNEATVADGTTELTIDRDWRVPLDATSVIEIATLKSKVVFARNTFKDVAVGAQLYAGGYDFVIDGNHGASMEGTYCYANDFMSSRSSSTDVQRRFSRCYFDQWINNSMNNQVDATYPWAENPTGGVSTPYSNGLVGAHVAAGVNLLPPERGLGAVGNIIRGNQVKGFTLGLARSGGNGPLPSPVPMMGQDNVVEQNQTQSVPIGALVEDNFPDCILRDNTCTSGCTTTMVNQDDGGE